MKQKFDPLTILDPKFVDPQKYGPQKSLYPKNAGPTHLLTPITPPPPPKKNCLIPKFVDAPINLTPTVC